MDRYEDLSALTAASRVPIAGGELHSAGLPELGMMIERRCYNIFQPDAIFTGGIAQTMEVIRLLRKHGLAYSPHTWTNGIGLLLNLHLACGVPNCDVLEYPFEEPGWVPEARDAMLIDPPRPRDGVIEVPRGPGIGVELDREVMEKHGTRL